ncbi:MAG: PQQ-binding-like beta-propeller repeat protein [Acetobacterales bacterium]
MKRLRATAVAVAFAAGLTGCSLVDRLLEVPEDPLPGERISVLEADRTLQPDSGMQSREVLLPRPTPNPEWPQPGGYQNHAMHHIAVGENLQRAWTANVGSGTDGDRRILSPPVVAAGRVYTIDADAVVQATDQSSGRELWRFDAQPPDESSGLPGGGISYWDGRLYVATGLAEVMALDDANGQVLWRRPLSAPARSGPTVLDGRVFVTSVDNQLLALSSQDGSTLWSHRGAEEMAMLLGTASPAVEEGLVVTVYSSGEIFALRVETGRTAWQDSLVATRQPDAVSALADIRAMPVIDRGRVHIISNAGLHASYDLRSGARLWDREIGGVETPWVAGGYIFLITTSNELVALTRDDGSIAWVRQLARFIDNDPRNDPVSWTGPVLVGDRLIAAGSHGVAIAISPYDGTVLGSVGIPDGVTVPPVVAGETVFFLTEGAQLVAYR